MAYLIAALVRAPNEKQLAHQEIIKGSPFLNTLKKSTTNSKRPKKKNTDAKALTGSPGLTYARKLTAKGAAISNSVGFRKSAKAFP